MSTGYHIKQAIRSAIPRALLQERYARQFYACREWENLHLGRFNSFAEARASLGSRGLDGHYAIDPKKWAVKRATTFAPHDYPVLFWLGKIVKAGGKLVDVGGSIGVTYYLYRERLAIPSDLSWVVIELPEVVAIGRELVTDNDAPQLSFTDNFSAIDGAAIFFSAGALQFFDGDLTSALSGLVNRPEHLLINRLPLIAGAPTFVTLQNTGQSIAPVRVEKFSEFVESVEALGYKKIDVWKCLENSLALPFHPELNVPYFYGFYFKKIASLPAV